MRRIWEIVGLQVDNPQHLQPAMRAANSTGGSNVRHLGAAGSKPPKKKASDTGCKQQWWGQHWAPRGCMFATYRIYSHFFNWFLGGNPLNLVGIVSLHFFDIFVLILFFKFADIFANAFCRRQCGTKTISLCCHLFTYSIYDIFVGNQQQGCGLHQKKSGCEMATCSSTTVMLANQDLHFYPRKLTWLQLHPFQATFSHHQSCKFFRHKHKRGSTHQERQIKNFTLSPAVLDPHTHQTCTLPCSLLHQTLILNFLFWHC